VGPALRGRVAALAQVVGVMAAVDVAFPVVFGLFDRHVSIEDLVTAALGHGGCGALGVALGLVAVPPTVRRPPTAFLVIAVYALLAVPLYDIAPVLSPAAWLAAAITDTDPRTVAGPVVLAAVVAVVQAAVVLAAARRCAGARHDPREGGPPAPPGGWTQLSTYTVVFCVHPRWRPAPAR
jgi:hypothetical protein